MSANISSFYEKNAQAAIEQQIKYGIPASITLCQMGLESGMGTSNLSTQYNNYFGIKKGSSWTGEVAYKYDDHSYPEAFRVYNSAADSMEDHSKLLMKDRYASCRKYSSTDYENWAKAIKASGYATDASYASKLINTIRSNNLDKYDQMALEQAKQRGLQIGYMRNSNSQTTTPSETQKIWLTPLQGNWSLPIDLSKVKVSGVYNEPRPGHKHGGLDLSTQGKYYSIYATEDNGKVSKVGNQPGGAGNYIKVEYTRADGTKMQTTYMHLSQIDVKEGDIVNAGQNLGVSGNTGSSSGPHLHFETEYCDKDGKWQKFDPTLYLSEIEVRNNENISLDKNGKDYLAETRSQMQITTNGNVQQDPNMSLLANVTNSNDPTKWLAYLMQQNNEEASGQDMFSSIISTMFKSALALVIKMKTEDEQALKEQYSSQFENKEASKEQENIVKRNREESTIDSKSLQLQASVNFDKEYPEQQEANVLRRA